MKRNSNPPPQDHQEIRRVAYGSIYWLRHVSGDLWMVTADGVSISAPADYNAALAALNSVTK